MRLKPGFGAARPALWPVESSAEAAAAAAAQNGAPAARLKAARRILLFERCWRRFTPLLLVILAFAACAWLNIFTLLPGFLHGLLLLIFAVLYFAAAVFLCGLRRPNMAEALARLEHDSGLHHDELRLAGEKLAPGAPPAAQALWREHKRRVAQALPPLKLRPPRPNLPAYDYYALRAAVFLLFAVAFCFQLGPAGGRLSDAFYFGPRLSAADLRITAWINPPDYTGRPPVYPIIAAAADAGQGEAGAESDKDMAAYSVPAGSVLTVRINDHGRGLARLSCNSAAGAAAPARQADAAATIYNLRIQRSVECRLAAPSLSRVWQIKAEPDRLPQISWVQPPERALNGLLTLNYRLYDDYGIKRAWAEITPLQSEAAAGQAVPPTPYFARLKGAPQVINRAQGSLTQWRGVNLPLTESGAAKMAASAGGKGAGAPQMAAPLIAPPRPDLRLPRFGPAGDNGLRGGPARTDVDLTASPWSGAYVSLRLAAEDAAGQVSYSAPMRLTLPQKTYASPISRALIEQRRILAANAAAAPRTRQMLAALLLRPDKTIPDKGAALALYSLMARYRLLPPPANAEALQDAADEAGYEVNDRQLAALLQAQTQARAAALRDIVAYMGAIADGIDGSGLAAAQKRLKLAAQALREALRNGASQQEIARLMQNLREAMQDYIAMLAERGMKPPADGKEQMLGESDLDKKLKAMEDAARSGRPATAEQMLAEFEDLMKNLQVTQGKGGGNGPGGKSAEQQMQKQMDKLSDIMRRQQQLLDETHKQREQTLRGEEGGGQDNSGQKQDKDSSRQGGQSAERQSPGAKQGQLRQDLQNLQKQLEQQNLAPKDGFGRALDNMQAGQEALNRGDAAGAQQNQAQALQSLREEAQNLMGKMREALARQDAAREAQKGGSAGGNNDSAQGQDPLGRPAGQGQAAQQGNELPDGAQAAARARQILEEIRRKLGALTPRQEKEYLERLLNLN